MAGTLKQLQTGLIEMIKAIRKEGVYFTVSASGMEKL